MKQQKAYGNESISSLKGADRVRLRPAVIFGSDGLEGCEHAVFEILSLLPILGGLLALFLPGRLLRRD